MHEFTNQRIVLLGLGHTNAHIARMWGMNPIPNTELVCLSDYSTATYSGMLPGVLAGDYPPTKMEIDLVRLMQSVGATLITEPIRAIDPANRTIEFSQRPALSYSLLSIGVGSRPDKSEILADSSNLLFIKPMQTFLNRLEAWSERYRSEGKHKPKISIVGGGVGGIEIACCLPYFLGRQGIKEPEITLISSGEQLASGLKRGTRRRIEQVFAQKSIQTVLGQRVKLVDHDQLQFDDGTKSNFDLVIWCTHAVAPELLEQVPLEKDDRGFLLTRPTLQSKSDDNLFAVGDSGTIEGTNLPKAGVYAVRQGKVLWNNLRLALQKEPLEDYVPQRKFLKLINVGDKKAIAEYGWMNFKGNLAWKWKDRIDVSFIEMYQEYAPYMPKMTPSAENEMRCQGCGGKIGGSALSRVLKRLDVSQNDSVEVGLDQPDDCAVVKTDDRSVLTTDFFAAPFADPYLTGRVAALNSLSDIFVMGARPDFALANITLPVGRVDWQESVLEQLLAGSLHEFKQSGTALVGGHTIEGPQLTAGFTIVARPGEKALFQKNGLRSGDRLVLTKPLGIGVLLAANMQAACPASCYETMLQVMLNSNQHAVELLTNYDISAMTDVTGFGLAGHLLELLKASRRGARIELSKVPLMDGAESLIKKGIESTLAPANRDAETNIAVSDSVRDQAGYKVLFDPQTCGGVLCGVSSADEKRLLSELDENGVSAVSIGEVIEGDDAMILIE